MTVQEQYELLEKTVRGYNPAADFDHIRSAFEYADRCHEGQKRKSGEPRSRSRLPHRRSRRKPRPFILVIRTACPLM